MSEYRFYTIEKTGRIEHPASDHIAPDDAAAIQKARQLLDGRDIEIWQGARLVAYLVPEEKTAPAGKPCEAAGCGKD